MMFRSLEFQTTFWLEIVTRAFLSVVFLELEQLSPFVRKIHFDELWLYKNPRTPSYVPTNILWPMVFLVPTFVMVIYYFAKRDRTELSQGLLAFTLALGLNGVVTNIIKLVVGRPRPDFFYRCFPDGMVDINDEGDISELCTGAADAIEEGRKSFPSGHASFSFCSLGFLSLWLFGKLGVFHERRGEAWRLITGSAPLLVALFIALSRTCDYHHHWQDVLVGSMLGFMMSYLCYRQYYPALSSFHSNLPYVHLSFFLPVISERHIANGGPHLDSYHSHDFSPMEEQVKWI